MRPELSPPKILLGSLAERKSNIEILKGRVDQAFANRELETYHPGSDVSDELLADLKKQSALYKGLDDSEFVDFGQYVEKINRVAVDTPEEYPILLRLSFKRLYKGESFSNDKLKEITQNICEHEFDHAAPFLGYPETEVRYGVEFTEDNVTHVMCLKPYIMLNGKVSVEAHKISLSNPQNLSDGDNVAIENS